MKRTDRKFDQKYFAFWSESVCWIQHGAIRAYQRQVREAVFQIRQFSISALQVRDVEVF